jgi:hypothetical protein
MPRSISAFRPYDRATGTELSQKQHEDCQAHHLVIKAYIDGIESLVPSPLPWTRKKLRCPTADLLDAIESIAGEIKKGEKVVLTKEDGSSNLQPRAEQEGLEITASPLDAPSVQRYQHAVNLLHELVSRVADVSPVDLQAQWLLFPAPSGLDGSSPNSHASTAFSNAAASRSSQLTDSPPKTSSSWNSNGVIEADGKSKGAWNTSILEPEETSFKMDPLEEHIDDEMVTYTGKKEKVTYNWVLEYLRGGWLSNSSTAAADSSISRLSTLREDSFSGSDVRHLHQIEIDTPSTYSENAIHLGFTSAGARPAKPSRPIPTMALRLRSKVSHEFPYGTGIKPSVASEFEQFKTPKSVISGVTLFCTPDGTDEDPHPMAQTRYGRNLLVPSRFKSVYVSTSRVGPHMETVSFNICHFVWDCQLLVDYHILLCPFLCLFSRAPLTFP